MTTGNVKMLPTAAKPLASTLENPSDIMTLGEYVVSGLQVAKTQAMARKCGHFRTFRIVLNTPARGNLRLVYCPSRGSVRVTIGFSLVRRSLRNENKKHNGHDYPS